MTRRFLGFLSATAFLVAGITAQSAATDVAGAIASTGVNVANVPDCAKVCLSNSTLYATGCAQIDVKCLCNSQPYVSALSCCLATNCNAADQQTAIQFNIQECAAVNSTAPSFVGCSPFSLTTGGGRSTAATATGDNAAISTLGSDLASIATGYTNTNIGTASFDGYSLLTGSCTIPLFAAVTQDSGNKIEFPQIGCALNRGGCCPFDPSQYQGLTKCPADYTTTSGACCPSGYSIFSTLIGAETPCFSKASKTYLPASTLSGSQVVLFTDTIFSRKFNLLEQSDKGLSAGAIAGITVAAVVAAAGTLVFLIWLIRAMKKQNAEKLKGKEVKSQEEPAIGLVQPVSQIAATPAQSPQELGSPGPMTPSSFKGVSTHTSIPGTPTTLPAYEVPAAIPLEMPGSTYMHEHHPAYTGSQSDLTLRTPPRSPPQSPGNVSTRSPVLSPASFRTHSPGTTHSINITPLGSPRFREGTM